MADGARFDESLKRIKIACDISGLNLGPDNYYKYLFIYLFNFIWLNSDVLCSLAYVWYGIARGEEFIEVTYGGPCVTCSILGTVKALAIVANGDKLIKLFATLREMEIRSLTISAKDFKDKRERDVDYLHSLLGVLNVAYTFLVAAFSVSSAMITGYTYWKTGEVKLRLPFYMLYPFDPFQMSIWPFIYFHQCYSAVVTVIWLAAVDYIFYVCCTYISIQFRFLEHQFEHAISLDSKRENFQDKLTEMVENHQELIRCTRSLEVIYSKTTLWNFVSSSLIICLTGFDVIMISDPLLVMSFVSFLLSSMGQVYYFCYFGDLIWRSSVAVGEGAYRSLWFAKDASYGKALLLVIIRSKSPCKLTAYGFADVNIPAFSRVLSNAWSYFALLNTTLK